MDRSGDRRSRRRVLFPPLIDVALMPNYSNHDGARDLLRASGLSFYSDLFADVPETFRASATTAGQDRTVQERANIRNLAASVSAEDGPVYLGAGYYDHMVPSWIDRLASQIEFSRMNASEDAEISDELRDAVLCVQQTALRLTGMESADVSFYWGEGGALVRSCLIALEATGRRLVLAPETLSSERLNLLKSYFHGGDSELRVIPGRNGITDLDFLRQTLEADGDRVAATIVPYPNFYGNLERVGQISEATRRVGASVIMTVDPVALATLRSPAEWGADLAVCDVHTTPIHKEDGDVRLGVIAASYGFLANAPERLAGSVVDRSGNREFFLLRHSDAATRQKTSAKGVARARGALRTLAYLASAEPRELRRIANTSRLVAQYARDELAKAGFMFHHDAPFLREFAVKLDDPRGMLNYLERWGIVGGYELQDGLVLAFTEKRTMEEVDELVYFMREYRDRARHGDDASMRQNERR